MADIVPFENPDPKPKSFWQRPEGMTGLLFMAAIVGGIGFLLYTYGSVLIGLVQTTIGLTIALAALAALLYVIFDPKMRNLIWYMYKSVMRTITGVFVKIDPIGILKSYVDDLQDNIVKMRKQIGALRGQMRKLSTIMESNTKEIEDNMKLAQAARDQGKEQQLLLSSRKAARLKESNEKYQKLYNKMDVLYKILEKMHKNSEILLEDTRDQVKMKEQERKAIRTSHSAMKSAMSIISGNPDKRAMFEMAMEEIADDVGNKIGEMEHFMEMSSKVMDSVDLQNGVFEEEGLRMLEEWEKKSGLMLPDEIQQPKSTLDLNQNPQEGKNPQQRSSDDDNSYDNFFK